MTRCEAAWSNPDRTSPTRRLRCTDEAVWLCDRRWLCDGHAQETWAHLVADLSVPRSHGNAADPHARYAPWAADALTAKAGRVSANALRPVDDSQPSLFEGAA